MVVEDGMQFIPKFGMMRESGVNKLVFTGNGVHIYLDSTNANKLVYLMGQGVGNYGIAALIIAVMPGGLAIGTALAVAAGLIALGINEVNYAASSGRGIIIKCYGDIPNLIPYNVVSQ